MTRVRVRSTLNRDGESVGGHRRGTTPYRHETDPWGITFDWTARTPWDKESQTRSTYEEEALVKKEEWVTTVGHPTPGLLPVPSPLRTPPAPTTSRSLTPVSTGVRCGGKSSLQTEWD